MKPILTYDLACVPASGHHMLEPISALPALCEGNPPMDSLNKGPLIGHRWIPLRKDQWCELWCFLYCYLEQAVEQTAGLPVIWDVMTILWRYCYDGSPVCKWAHCPACRTYEIATRFWVVVICPIIKCLTVLEFSFILFDLCLFITVFNFILNYVLIVTFWIFTYHKIRILLIIYCFIWNYWIIYFLTCLEVSWSVVS